MTVRKDFHGLKQLLQSKQPILYQNMFFFRKLIRKYIMKLIHLYHKELNDVLF